MNHLRLLSLSLLVAGLLTGCPGTPPDPVNPTNCSADSDCTSVKGICHPVGKVCVPTCTIADDCPANQKNCAPLKDATGKLGTQNVCQCSTSAICADTANGGAAGLVCSDVDNICEQKCVADSDCTSFSPARKCDTAKGFCVSTPPGCTTDSDCKDATKPKCDTVTKACVPAPLSCKTNADCKDASKPLCNTTTGACEPPLTCDPAKTAPGTNGGPDICKRGEFCATDKTCTSTLATETCDAAVGYTPMGTASAAPVVFNVKPTGVTRTQGAVGCNGKLVTEFQGNWYAGTGTVSSTGSYGKISYITKAGVKPTAAGTNGNTEQNTSITVNADGKSGTFKFELCEPVKGLAQGVVLRDDAGNESNVGCYVY